MKFEPTKIRNVHFARDVMRVDLLDGRSLSVPLAWYPTLMHASDAVRRKWKHCGAGTGLHWPALDYHLSAEGLLAEAHRRLCHCQKPRPA